MGSYTTVDKIFNTFPKIKEATSVTSEHIEVQILYAESMINARLANYYEVPITGAPLLEMVATDLTLFRLLALRIMTAETLKDSPWPARFKETKDVLDKLASGAMTLVASDGSIIEARTDRIEITSTTEDFHPFFDEGLPEEWFADPDKLDAITDDKDL